MYSTNPDPDSDPQNCFFLFLFPFLLLNIYIQLELQKVYPKICSHRLNIALRLQSLFGLHVQSCNHWLRPRNRTSPPLPPRIWAHIQGRYWSAKIGDISLRPPVNIGRERIQLFS
jgi:hypothetical protein